MPQPWTALFALAAAALGLASLAALLQRGRARRRVGTPVWSAGHGRRMRWALALASLACAGWIAAGAGPPAPLPCAALGLAALASWLRPGADEERCGTHGVQRGWIARSFAELDEWRLIGEHLRFRLGPRWHAVRLPGALHGSTRERLEALAAGRESALS